MNDRRTRPLECADLTRTPTGTRAVADLVRVAIRGLCDACRTRPAAVVIDPARDGERSLCRACYEADRVDRSVAYQRVQYAAKPRGRR